MKSFLIAALMAMHALVSVAATTPGAPAAVSSARVTVNGMVCAFCAQGIEKRLQQMSATEAVWVDMKKKVVLVQAKPKQTLDQKAISEEIVNAGYEVVKFELLTQTVAEMKSALQAKP